MRAGAALNALALVEPPQAWLEDPAGPAAPDLAPGAPASTSPAPAGFLGSPLLRGPYLPAPASPRSPLPEGLQEVLLAPLHSSAAPCHTNHNMALHEHALAYISAGW